LVLIVSCSKSKQQELSTNTSTILSVKNYQLKTLQVYTTAKDTELRLTKTSEQTFKPKVQPLETEVAIFVNPEKTFQEYLGIGGAITDASEIGRAHV
jgi:glucosylceramidase